MDLPCYAWSITHGRFTFFASIALSVVICFGEKLKRFNVNFSKSVRQAISPMYLTVVRSCVFVPEQVLFIQSSRRQIISHVGTRELMLQELNSTKF